MRLLRPRWLFQGASYSLCLFCGSCDAHKKCEVCCQQVPAAVPIPVQHGSIFLCSPTQSNLLFSFIIIDGVFALSCTAVSVVEPHRVCNKGSSVS